MQIIKYPFQFKRFDRINLEANNKVNCVNLSQIKRQRKYLNKSLKVLFLLNRD